MPGLNKDGMFSEPWIVSRRCPHIEHGSLVDVHAIVIHQTDSASSSSVFSAYILGGNGAHFLIEKNGTIYQTASLRKRCYHVGQRIKSRCLEIMGKACPDAAVARAATLGWVAQCKAIDRIERDKSYPQRYPINSDSIGIELVGRHVDEKAYEPATLAQLTSLQRLIDLLYKEYSLGPDDVFRHPEISYKTPGEAASATWK